MANKKIHIIGGGTTCEIAPHLSLCAEAYGSTAHKLEELCVWQGYAPNKSKKSPLDVVVHLTKMAGGKTLCTNQDISNLIDTLVADPTTKIIFLTAALCDYAPKNGKRTTRFKTRDNPEVNLDFVAVEKIVSKIRKKRKDIVAVAFKATSGYTAKEQYIAGLNLLKESSVNLVFANDEISRLNMIITPEEARYSETTDRKAALAELVKMAIARSQLTFTRSTVVDGKPVPWNSPLVYDSLKKVVDHCISRGAYKAFRGATVGHFACKLNENTFLTSIRKSNFNELEQNGLVKVITDGPDSVIAYGAKPSVGGQSQRIVFHEHSEYDCIVHFHCEKRPDSPVPVVSQKEYECGSLQCGENTSKGLKSFGNLSAVFLDNHGPNIVFHHDINPQEVIQFIEDNFDLSSKTGGYVS